MGSCWDQQYMLSLINCAGCLLAQQNKMHFRGPCHHALPTPCHCSQLVSQYCYAASAQLPLCPTGFPVVLRCPIIIIMLMLMTMFLPYRAHPAQAQATLPHPDIPQPGGNSGDSLVFVVYSCRGGGEVGYKTPRGQDFISGIRHSGIRLSGIRVRLVLVLCLVIMVGEGGPGYHATPYC